MGADAGRGTGAAVEVDTGENRIADGPWTRTGHGRGEGHRRRHGRGYGQGNLRWHGKWHRPRQRSPVTGQQARSAVVVCVGRHEVVRFERSGRYFDPFCVLCEYDDSSTLGAQNMLSYTTNALSGAPNVPVSYTSTPACAVLRVHPWIRRALRFLWYVDSACSGF